MFKQVAVAQLNATVGDLSGNCQKIIAAAHNAYAQGATLLVCPELFITGYPPEDLALQPAFQHAAMQAAEQLAAAAKDLCAILIGGICVENGAVHNTVFLLEHGRIAARHYKVMLPNDGIFDEKRLFTPANAPTVITCQNIRTGLLICEDAWHPQVADALKQQGAERIIIINASPFETNKRERRVKLIADMAIRHQLPILYVNLIGGQDDIIFDGGSFSINLNGKMDWHAGEFTESVQLWNAGTSLPLLPDEQERTWQAAVLGLRDYANKNRFSGVVLGLSGGIDSAVTAAMAVDALGPERVLGVRLPSPYTSKDSMEDAAATAQLLGIRITTLPITTSMDAMEATLFPMLDELGYKNGNRREDIAIGGNLQARIRGVLLMGVSNATGHMLLNTSNKSELAMGFSTLYGDSCGGYAPLKDIYKTHIFTLAHWRNAHKPANMLGPEGTVIPERSITKPPSAELKPGQKDEDQLPPYPILDGILKRYLEERASAQAIIAEGYNHATVEKMLRLVRISEYKRRQSPPGTRVSPMQFGRDRRFPLTNVFSEFS